MGRGILLISIIVAGLILILFDAMLSYITRHSDTNGLNIINSTDGRDGHQTTAHTQTSAALEESKNVGSIENVPNKCLGSALCKYWYPRSLFGLISNNIIIFY